MSFNALLLLLFSGAAQAVQAEEGQWSCAHTTGGHIQNQANVQNPTDMRYGWGLDFDQKSNTSNWIHFSVPSVHGSSIRFVALKFWTGSVEAVINQVHVWDLDTQVRTFKNLGWSGGWRIEKLDMPDPPVKISALNISVETKAGDGGKTSHRFIFSGACAYLIPGN
jgi:hypothetical protein